MFAQNLIITGGYADYKGQVGGGHYELDKIDYYINGRGEYKLDLVFGKKQKYFLQEMPETIFAEIINARQVVFKNEIETIHAQGRKGKATMQSQNGKMTIFWTITE